MIPADDVERLIEGARQVQHEDAGFRKQIATEHLGRRRGSGSGRAITTEGKM
jgi:hypothetical protein